MTFLGLVSDLFYYDLAERLDSDEEIEKEIKAKRKLTAQRHWAVIRRDVKDKIMQRKKNNTTDKSWIILRSQCLAKTGTNRQQLYERYGISSISTGKRHSIDKTSRPYSFHASRTHQGKSSRDGSKSAQVPRTSEKSCKSPRLCEEYLLPYNVQQIINRFHAWEVKSISRSADSYYDSINDQNDNSDS